MKKLQPPLPPEKSNYPLSQQPLSQNWDPVKPTPAPFFENLVEGSTLSPAEWVNSFNIIGIYLFSNSAIITVE